MVSYDREIPLPPLHRGSSLSKTADVEKKLLSSLELSDTKGYEP